MLTSAASEPASILSMTRKRWTSTVRGLTSSTRAISLLVFPVTTWSITSRSRGVSNARLRSYSARRDGSSRRGACRSALPDARDQVVVLERLLDEIHGAPLHRSDRHGHAVGCREEHDGQGRAAAQQLLLQLEPRHAGHQHVEQQHARAGEVAVVEQRLARREGLDLESRGLEQAMQRGAHRIVVVHDEHARRWRRLGHDLESGGGALAPLGNEETVAPILPCPAPVAAPRDATLRLKRIIRQSAARAAIPV